ncbi:MAG: hypothetical protein E6I60_09375, partial [Chloroflexi bacterium]
MPSGPPIVARCRCRTASVPERIRSRCRRVRTADGIESTISPRSGRQTPSPNRPIRKRESAGRPSATRLEYGPARSSLIGSLRLHRVGAFTKEQVVVGQQVISRIDAVIAGRRLLAHPFYQRWLAGDLTLDDLRAYAGQYYKFEAAFPGYLTKVLAKLEMAADRKVLLQNL